MTAYYNDNDPFVCAWLRELIKANLIAPGEVDERSIEEVKPDDLQGFTQCHFFAGIGVWSYALRNAGWADDSPVWTGSCPCQGFSASGQRGGFSDKRHLWPAWFRLVRECRPVTVFGEQVASKDGLAWLDVVSADMERTGYAIGATDICAAGFGAPHIRQRLYFVADSASVRHQRQPHEQPARVQREGVGAGESWEQLSNLRPTSSPVADTEREQFRAGGSRGIEPQAARMQRADGQRKRLRDDVGERGSVSNVGQSKSNGRIGRQNNGDERRRQCSPGSASPLNGFWRDAEWIYCRDEKWRPAEPGSFPLVNGTPNRVGRLRGYGNAINAEVAKGFIEAYMTI